MEKNEKKKKKKKKSLDWCNNVVQFTLGQLGLWAVGP